jgi:hypothetical protein
LAEGLAPWASVSGVRRATRFEDALRGKEVLGDRDVCDVGEDPVMTDTGHRGLELA